MTDNGKRLFGLSTDHKQRIIDRMRNRGRVAAGSSVTASAGLTRKPQNIAEEFYQIDDLPGLKQLQIQALAAEKFEIENPFFLCHDACDP